DCPLKIHPNEAVLEELLLSLRNDQRIVLGHLFSCECCRRRFDGVEQRRLQAGPSGKILSWPGDPYGEALDRTLSEMDAHRQVLARERALAPALFVELSGYSITQKDLILRNDARFRTWGLFELLIERSFETAIEDSAHAEELGLLALRLSDQLDPEIYDPGLIEDYRGRAWAHIGNARRIRSDLRGAEEAFDNADAYLRQGTQDIVERAIFLDLKASLRRDQRQFDEATKLLRRAVSIFIQLGHRHRAGRTLVKLSTVRHFAGNIEEAIPLLYQALELIDPEEEPRLLLSARHNLIDNLTEMGRHLEAQRRYRETRPLYRDFPAPWAQNRRKWVRGKIARGLGQLRMAESLFRTARNGFVEEGIPYDTALVSLDLAVLYAQQGRMRDLKRLAFEMVPIFSSLQIHREALAALAFLKKAMESEQANLELVTGVAAFLRNARLDPALKFEG
ncbi:MAG TPA: tetratricopeptide repeat protein, partial [Thermoanaerobaculia bacterium]|nr:tetratricopeptide repeat protein [Thermoanaerobaculia bacterium]